MNSFKRSYIVFSVFFAAYFGEIVINIACGPHPDPYDYYVSYFHNNIPGDEYVPFSFTDMRFLYKESETVSESMINSGEWADYLGEQVSAHDVERLMYRTNAATDSLILAYLNGSNVKLPDSLVGNTYLTELKKDEAARNYFLFSKELEPYAAVTYQGYWNPDPRDSMDMRHMKHLADRAVQKADESGRNNFFRLRYAYQATRMYHYSSSYERCIETYDKYMAPIDDHSAVLGWALALKAGATRRLGEPAEAALLFSKVFTISPERRVQAYKNYHYIDVPFEEVLTLAQSERDLAALWAIRGFNNADFDQETLASVYALAPESVLVGVLYTREINKLESQLTEGSPYYHGRWWDYYRTDSIQAQALDHVAWMAGFSQKLAAEKHYNEPELGVVGEAYLQWLVGDITKAETLLSSLRVDQLSDRLADQYRIVELLTKIHQLTVTDSGDEETMLPALQWLDQQRQAETERLQERYGREDYYWKSATNLRFDRTATNLYQSVLAPHYMQQKDTAMAALLMWKGGDSRTFWQEQLQPAALEQLLSWAKNGVDRPWAPLFERQLGGFESDEFWDLLGTAYLRMHDYTAAVKVFDRLSPDFSWPTAVNWYSFGEETLWPDPFVTTVKDFPKEFGYKALSKAEFAVAMAGLQQKIKEDPQHAAEYYFQLANGVYQTGAFGNAWQLISYRWTSTDNYLKGNYYYADDYHEARQAAKWYQQARDLSNDREFQAKCTFMLAKCEQKTYTFDSLHNYYDTRFRSENGQPDAFWVFSQRNKYFSELRAEYLDTEFIRSAAVECTYLADFITPDFL